MSDKASPKALARSKITTSYGLIVFTHDGDEVRYLMTRRRDTFSYECILRGQYTPERLVEYVAHTTEEERARLMRYPFEPLWKDLWVSPKRRLYRMEFRRAKEIFEENAELIRSLIEACPTVGRDVWEFPKGRVFSEESGFQCALREFEEETNIKRGCVSVLKNAGVHEDNYQGTDHNMYRSVYFIGYIEDGLSIPLSYQPCPYGMRADFISDEVMDVKWLSYEEAVERCSPGRRAIVESVHAHISK